MKKNSKILFVGIIALLGVLSTVTVFAGQYWLYLEIPRAQGYAYTDDETGNGKITGANSNYATVYPEGFTKIEAVTFYAGAYSSDKDDFVWGSKGGILYREDFESGNQDEVSVPYGYTYGKSQKMGLKARNHNWSLNNGTVSGVVDYH